MWLWSGVVEYLHVWSKYKKKIFNLQILSLSVDLNKIIRPWDNSQKYKIVDFCVLDMFGEEFDFNGLY